MQSLCKLLRSHAYAAHALNALQYDGTDIPLRQFNLPCRKVVHRQISYVSVVVDGSDNLRVVRHLYGKTGASVESLFCRQHSCASVGKRSQFQRILVSFSPAVDEKQLVVVISADASQPFSQFSLKFVDNRIGVESQFAHLLGYLLNIVWMRMTNADDGMTAIQVQVLLPLVVPYLASLSPDNVHVEEGIYVE